MPGPRKSIESLLGCPYLLFSLPESTLIRFGAWNVIGLLFYYFYSRSGARQDAAAA